MEQKPRKECGMGMVEESCAVEDARSSPGRVGWPDVHG